MKLDEAIEMFVCPATHPVAIKFLQNESELPRDVKRASELFGHKIQVCQGWGMSRCNLESVAMLKDDIVCALAIIALGLGEPPESWWDGDLYLQWYTEDKNVARKIAKSMPRIPAKRYVGLVTAPLEICHFQPDMVLVYGTPQQGLMLMHAEISREGPLFPASLWTYGLCADALAAAHETGRCRLAIPCGGDMRYGHASEHEVAIAIPAARFEEIAERLEFLEQHGHMLPRPRFFDYTPTMREKYRKLRELL